MKHIKVLGSGCANCVKAAELIEKTASEEGVSVIVTKETDPKVIMGYGVMSTPAVVIDEELIHTGSVPKPSQVKAWLV